MKIAAIKNKVRDYVKKEWRESPIFWSILVSIIILRLFVYTQNIIPSGSMMPQVVKGDVVTVNKLAYHLKIPLTNVVLLRWSEPSVGDVISLNAPDGTYMAKRVIAKGGDRVSIKNNELYVNGEKPFKVDVNISINVHNYVKEYSEVSSVSYFREFLGDKEYIVAYLNESDIKIPILNNYLYRDLDLVVEQDHYFVMGDNRNGSADSRAFGLVYRDNVVGQVHYQLFNIMFFNPNRAFSAFKKIE